MKKMAVVPQTMVEKLMQAQRNEQQLVSDSPVVQLSHLDREMQQILQSKQPSDVKATQYAKILQTYTNIRNKLVTVPEPTPQDEPQSTTPQHVPEEVLEKHPQVFRSLADRYVNKGKIIYENAMKNPAFEWNDKEELIYKGKRIPGSSLTDLIHAFARPTKDQPIGWRVFGQALIDSNVPKTVIVNKKLLGLVEKPIKPIETVDTRKAPWKQW